MQNRVSVGVCCLYVGEGNNVNPETSCLIPLPQTLDHVAFTRAARSSAQRRAMIENGVYGFFLEGV